MARLKLFQLREKAEAAVAAGITDDGAFDAALPLLIQFTKAIENNNDTTKECNEVAKALSEILAQYMIANPHLCETPPITDGNGVTRYDVSINEADYHLSNGFGGIKAISGGHLTADFLATLPKKWLKSKTELDIVGINRLGVTDAELEDKGLYRPEKNVWSVA